MSKRLEQIGKPWVGWDAGKVSTNRRRGLRKNRCWKGYKPVKGKRAYSKGSCRKVRRNAKGDARRQRESDAFYQKYMGPGGALRGLATREELSEYENAGYPERNAIQNRVWNRVQMERINAAKKAGRISNRTARAMVRAGLPLSRSELRGNGPYSRTILKILKSPIEAYSKGKRVNDLYEAVLIRFGDGPDGELGIMIGWRNRMGELVKTPGAWTLDSLKGASDTIAIDYGQGWFVRGMHGAIAEAKSDALYRIRDLKANPLSQSQKDMFRLKRASARGYRTFYRGPSKIAGSYKYTELDRIVDAIKNLKKRNYNDEMIESVVVKERPGHPRDFIIIVKHRYFVNGARVYSAGLKTEETIEKFVRVIGKKTKRIGSSDYVFNIYGIRFPEAIKKKLGKLFDNSSMAERYKKQSTRYLVTKKFTAGPMKGLTVVDESPVPFYVGFKPSRPYFGSPYIVTKTEVNYAGSKR